jgi:hypothetical protein
MYNEPLELINDYDKLYSYPVYYDGMGNKTFDKKPQSFGNNVDNFYGIIVKLDFDIKGKLLKTTKQLYLTF